MKHGVDGVHANIAAALMRLRETRNALAQAEDASDGSIAASRAEIEPHPGTRPVSALLLEALEADVLRHPARAIVQVGLSEMTSWLGGQIRVSPLLCLSAAGAAGALAASIVGTRRGPGVRRLLRMLPLVIGVARAVVSAPRSAITHRQPP